MNQEQIGKFIAKLRKEKNLTQEQLAEILCVNVKSVSRWENGKNLPDISILKEIAEYFDITISELINGHKMTKEELLDLKDVIDKLIIYNENKQNEKKKKLDIYFSLGLVCITFVILDNQFDIFSYIFKYSIPNFINGVLLGIGFVFELTGLYNIKHKETLRQRKDRFVRKLKMRGENK